MNCGWIGRFATRAVSGTTLMLQRPARGGAVTMTSGSSSLRMPVLGIGGRGIVFQRLQQQYSYYSNYHHPPSAAASVAAALGGGGSFLSRMRLLLLPQQQQPSASSMWMRLPMNIITARSKHTMKTHKGIAKRFKVRGNGSLRRTCSGRQHNTGWKSRRRINKLGLGSTVKTKSIDRGLKICLGVLGKQKRPSYYHSNLNAKKVVYKFGNTAPSLTENQDLSSKS